LGTNYQGGALLLTPPGSNVDSISFSVSTFPYMFNNGGNQGPPPGPYQ